MSPQRQFLLAVHLTGMCGFIVSVCARLLFLWAVILFPKSSQKGSELLSDTVRSCLLVSDTPLFLHFHSANALWPSLLPKFLLSLEISAALEHLPQLLPVPLLSLRVPVRPARRLAQQSAACIDQICSQLHFQKKKKKLAFLVAGVVPSGVHVIGIFNDIISFQSKTLKVHTPFWERDTYIEMCTFDGATPLTRIGQA